jgi:hypothetical protein
MQLEVEREIKLLLFISIVYEKIAGVQSQETSSRKHQEMVLEIIHVMTVDNTNQNGRVPTISSDLLFL